MNLVELVVAFGVVFTITLLHQREAAAGYLIALRAGLFFQI